MGYRILNLYCRIRTSRYASDECRTFYSDVTVISKAGFTDIKYFWRRGYILYSTFFPTDGEKTDKTFRKILKCLPSSTAQFVRQEEWKSSLHNFDCHRGPYYISNSMYLRNSVFRFFYLALSFVVVAFVVVVVKVYVLIYPSGVNTVD